MGHIIPRELATGADKELLIGLFRGMSYMSDILLDLAYASSGTLFTKNAVVAGATGSSALLPANVNRRGAIFYNGSTSNAYLALFGSGSSGAATSGSQYSFKLAAGGIYTMSQPVYLGAVYAIFDVLSTGSLVATEQT